MLFKFLDILHNSIWLLKLPFSASLKSNFSNMCLHMLSKFDFKSAQKWLIFPTKASYARCLFLFFLISASLYANTGYIEPWGKDASLKYEEKGEKTALSPSIFVKVAEKVILFHQNIISPVDGPRSHFRPTSSRYMLLAMRKHGFIKGYLMGCDRLLRENDDPWIYRTVEIGDTCYKHDPIR